jgi:predicted RNA binding protein YcfA (HicA-like mRNA interferase family)
MPTLLESGCGENSSIGYMDMVQLCCLYETSGSPTGKTMCIVHTMQSRQLIKLLQADGWQLQRTRGSHHQYVHPTKPGTVTVPHPKKDLGKGWVRAIRKQAGLK